jgi:hypothetical protein
MGRSAFRSPASGGLGRRGLNPDLLSRIERRIGPASVSSEGVGATPSQGVDPTTGTPRTVFTSSGEYYCVACPFCDDRDRHLWINHRYGTVDPVSGRIIDWAAICYRRDCLRAYENRLALRDMLLGFRNANIPDAGLRLRPPTREVEIGPVTLPGVCRPVDRLDPNHEAVRYLVGRGFDPVELTRDYAVSCCIAPDPLYAGANRRIIVPAYGADGTLLDWQGRWPADLDWQRTAIPKYYNLPSGHKSAHLYGLPRAREADALVIVEGVTSVWRIGREAVALRGKSLSAAQEALAVSWAETSAGPVVLALDGGDAERAAAEAMRARLEARIPGRVATLELPEGRDPAMYDRHTIRSLIGGAIARV